MADKMTRMQFSLSEKNMDVLRYMAAEQEVPVSVMLRMILRDLYNLHKAKIVSWKIENGQHVSTDDEVDAMMSGLDDGEPS